MKILIIGASGFLGSTLYKSYLNCDDVIVTGTYNNNNIDSGLIQLDVTDKNAVSTIISNFNPDIVIWSIYNMEKEAFLSNRGLSNLLNELKDKTKIVYVSTTIARGENQSESIQPVYRTSKMYAYKYVNGKIDGEKLIKTHPNHIIIRPGSIYGTDGYGRLDMRTETIKQHAVNKDNYYRAANLYTSFVNVDDLVCAITELIKIDFTDTINIAESSPLSHYEFSKLRAEQINIDSKYIKPNNVEETYEYSLDVTLSKKILKSKIRNL